ncbi:multiheme c-type cytochrome [Pseudooceanicola sp. HF7]|uniref:multiheme c-type cytochrome n=1 Tax=Pseudooceanicola sp. HF7 TaxID=2721560 RepID=UPI0014315EDB|nr:multiheme c-type cytochrome [Pseudooceanicola sp. HF7]NIZ11691.1 hypothetical protein [Pseudooceanicola sp. HF7]
MKRTLCMIRRALGLLLACLAGPVLAQDPGYVGSATCITCHEDAGMAWEGSHHDLAWTAFSDGAAVADFDGTEFQLGEMIARFRLDDDGGPRVSVTELDGETMEYTLHSVIGVEPLQQFVIETEPGRLQSFDVVWDTEAREWFHLYPDQDLPPEDAYHWTGPYKNWNGRCAACHATGFEANYDATTRRYQSRMVEIGVGCEACHGTGAAHVAWAEDYDAHGTLAPENYGFAVDFSDPEQTTQQCATCHSRREHFEDGNPLPGTPFHDAYNLSLLREGAYEADGQILDEVYVYGSFLQSKMHQKGVTCTDCHAPHSMELKAEGNAVCATCHSPAGNPRFPSLPIADFDSPAHTHHPVGSEGARCVNCHMVERVYMGNDWRADHSFRIPRPDLHGETGAPDACSTCHEGQSPAWAAEVLEDWFPVSTHRGAHFGSVIAAGRRDPVGALPALSSLAQDRDEPAIARATALYLVEMAQDEAAARALAALTRDPDPMVRAAAVKLQRVVPAQERLQSVMGLLADPVKSVRIAAAQAMLDAPIAYLPDRYGQMVRGAFGEWQGSMGNKLDYPETHLQMAGTALVMRNFAAAARAFAEVTELDPQHLDAWTMRVRIAAAIEGPGPALAIAEQGLEANPGAVPLLQLQGDLAAANQQGLTPPPHE